MKQKNTLQWLSVCHAGKTKLLVGAAGRGAGRAERFQHRLCVCAAAHHQYGRGRGAGRFLGIAGAADGHPAGADRVERGGPLFERVHQRHCGKPLQAPALLRPAYRRLCVGRGGALRRVDEPPDLGYHRGGGRRDQIVPGLIGMLVRLLGAVDRYFVDRAAFFVHSSPRRRGHDAADLCVPQDIETTAQEDSRNRRRAPGVLAGAAGKPCHRPHLCQGRTDGAAGRRPDGRPQSRPDEAQQFFQPVQHRLCRCHGRGVSAGDRVLRLRHPDWYHELRQPDGHYAAGGAGAKPVCQPDGISAAVLFHAGQRRAPNGSGSLCARQHRNGA